MVRATAAEMVKKTGGSYLAGHDATSYGNVATQVDAEIDGLAGSRTFGTGTNEIEFANELAVRKVIFGLWASGSMKTNPPPVWDSHMKQWFEALLTDTTSGPIRTAKMQE